MLISILTGNHGIFLSCSLRQLLSHCMKVDRVLKSDVESLKLKLRQNGALDAKSGSVTRFCVKYKKPHLQLLTQSQDSSSGPSRCCGGTSGTWSRSGTCWSRKCRNTYPAGCSTWSWQGCPCPSGKQQGEDSHVVISQISLKTDYVIEQNKDFQG